MRKKGIRRDRNDAAVIKTFLHFRVATIIIRMIKSRRVRWTGRVTRMGKRGMYIGYWGKS
jgi:hypothetical protein